MRVKIASFVTEDRRGQPSGDEHREALAHGLYPDAREP